MSTRSVHLHRVIRAKPEKLFRAFTEADGLAKWLPPYGFTCTVHHLEAVVGGTFKMSFRNFSTGNSHAFGGEYLELIPNKLIRYTDKFDDPNLPGVMQVTVKLEPVSCGTDLSVVQENIPEVIPVEMCYLGWQESLAQFATLVEPEIPG
jgi:uncharacterized protein YndB with AHSA1/START domain